MGCSTTWPWAMTSTMSSNVIDGESRYSPPCNARVNLRSRTARTKCDERLITPAACRTRPISPEEAPGGIPTIRPLPTGSTPRFPAAIPAALSATITTRTPAARRTRASAGARRTQRRKLLNPLTGPAARLHHRPAAALLGSVVIEIAVACRLVVHDLDVIVLGRLLDGRRDLAKLGFVLDRHQRLSVHSEHDGRVCLLRRLQDCVPGPVNLNDVHQAELVGLPILVEQRDAVTAFRHARTSRVVCVSVAPAARGCQRRRSR